MLQADSIREAYGPPFPVSATGIVKGSSIHLGEGFRSEGMT